MAKGKKKRKRSTTVKAKRCKMVKVIETAGKADKVKIGARNFKLCKGRAMDVHANGKTWVCPVGKSWKLSTSTGSLDSLCKVAKR